MSEKDYKKAKKLILKNEDEADFEGGQPDELIRKAEKLLNLKFSGSYLDFLQTFGAGSFGSEEIFGVLGEDFENSSIPDAVWYTLSLRKQVNLPESYLVIYELGDGEVYCLDFQDLNEFNEPKVVSIELGENEFEPEWIADGFGEFLLELAKEEL